jgi:hypothetical protein
MTIASIPLQTSEIQACSAAPQADAAAGGLRNAEALVKVALAIAAVGTTEFPKEIATLCLHVSHFDSVLICAFFAGDKPLPLYSNLSPEQDRRVGVPSVGSAHLLDPFYDLFKQNVGDRVVGLLPDCRRQRPDLARRARRPAGPALGRNQPWRRCSASLPISADSIGRGLRRACRLVSAAAIITSKTHSICSLPQC